ncbi:hypothetical protein [Micromonospora globbae]|uniref:Uncharacterized protein n=1 Tax=Micromonospora globbae TaxID=1894969 RepID=A0A420F3M5_9ACTN|nr:hypothetical protein [Micromonospora globbae]RKF27514.1 hypothetical protein D7I43_10735 [Micromonospora globbae]WTF86374.1 hypothetical protein OH732_01795 [Micromonospora globbae]
MAGSSALLRVMWGMVAAVVAMLLSGCDGSDEREEDRSDRALKEVLEEYRPRYEQRRVALADAASRVPRESPGKDSCDRTLDPEPDFVHFDHTSLVLDSYNSPGQGGNVDIAPLSEAGVPEQIADNPSQKLGRFAVAPGWLIRGMWVTGPQGPLGTNRFEVTSQYGYEPYKGVEKDPATRLRKILDVGLHKRYALLYRVTTYDDPYARDGDVKDVVRADVFLADLEKGDVPCRLTATGHDYDMEGVELSWHSGTPYEDMQVTFQLDIDAKLRILTRR